MAATAQLCALLTPTVAGKQSGPAPSPTRLSAELLDAANAALVTPRLRQALATAGTLESAPGDLTAFVERFHSLNRTRNALLAEQLAEAARAINAAGVEPLILKGAIALLSDDPDERARRVITDLDIQVPETTAPGVERALRGIGYGRLRSYTDTPHVHAVADLERPGDLAAVDLHRYLLSYAGHLGGRTHLAGLLPPEEVRARADRRRIGGADVLVPCPRDRILHLILQDQVQDRDHFAGRLKLRRLLDLADLLTGHPDVDTDGIVEQLRPYGLATAARSHLYSAHALFGAPVGAGVRASLAARVHHRRRLTATAHRRWAAGNAYLGALLYELARCRFPPGADGATLLRWRAGRLADVLKRRRLGLPAQFRDVAGRL